MDIHLDPVTPAPVGIIPGAGVILVHYCDDAAERARCSVCPQVTPERAAVHALQAAAAAGVAHDPAELWDEVRRAVHEQIEWRRTVAGLAAGELADEPPTRVLQYAGAGPTSPAPWSSRPAPVDVDGPTERIALPAGWREHTAPGLAPITGPLPPVESRRQAWARTVVLLASFVVMVAGATGYVVTSRPDTHTHSTAPDDPAAPPAAVELAGDGDQADDEPNAAGAGARHRAPTTEPAATPSYPPTMPPPTPAPRPTASGHVGGRTSVAPPAPSSSPSSSASSASPTGGAPSPTASSSPSAPDVPVPTDTGVVVVPVPSVAATPPAPRGWAPASLVTDRDGLSGPALPGYLPIWGRLCVSRHSPCGLLTLRGYAARCQGSRFAMPSAVARSCVTDWTAGE